MDKYTIVDCDGCGRDTSVLTDALKHPFCILVLCEDCAFAPADTEPYHQDVNHHVVGERVR